MKTPNEMWPSILFCSERTWNYFVLKEVGRFIAIYEVWTDHNKELNQLFKVYGLLAFSFSSFLL